MKKIDVSREEMTLILKLEGQLLTNGYDKETHEELQEEKARLITKLYPEEEAKEDQMPAADETAGKGINALFKGVEGVLDGVGGQA